MSSLFLTVLVFTQAIGSLRAEGKWPIVQLMVPDAPNPLAAPVQEQLTKMAVELVETSNFHSGMPGTVSVAEAQTNYRTIIRESFLLVTLPEQQPIKTVGGEIMVKEILLGLNSEDKASGLFTIDDSGRVVEHAKYSGQMCVDILKEIRQIMNL